MLWDKEEEEGKRVDGLEVREDEGKKVEGMGKGISGDVDKKRGMRRVRVSWEEGMVRGGIRERVVVKVEEYMRG